MVLVNLVLDKLKGKDVLEYVASDVPVLMTKEGDTVEYSDCEFREETYKIDENLVKPESFILRTVLF